jgi:hypothetical protein
VAGGKAAPLLRSWCYISNGYYVIRDAIGVTSNSHGVMNNALWCHGVMSKGNTVAGGKAAPSLRSWCCM